jgi:hypothetical protein
MPETSIRIMCPNLRCRSILAVPDEARGRLVRCKGCGSNIKVPDKAAPKPDEAAPSDAKAKPAA